MEQIYNERKDLGEVRQRHLAQILKCSQSAISQKFSGQIPLTDGEIEGLCDFFGVSLGQLESYSSNDKTARPPTHKREADIVQCRDVDHRKLHVAVEEILHSKAEWAVSIIGNIKAMHLAAYGPSGSEKLPGDELQRIRYRQLQQNKKLATQRKPFIPEAVREGQPFRVGNEPESPAKRSNSGRKSKLP